AAQAALDGLEHDLDALRFDALLQRLFDEGAAAFGIGEQPPASDDLLPSPGQALWLAAPDDAGAPRMATAGLPRGAAFDALFGFGDEALPMEVRP
ncbi:MAG: type VI secretion system-associated protein TagF, partial [Pseudomonadota bacterium]